MIDELKRLVLIDKLTGDFTKTVSMAIVIALPLSYFIDTEWLWDFAYRIDLQWWFFAGSDSLTLLIALITVARLNT
jgi:putative ABC transport system permease protein